MIGIIPWRSECSDGGFVAGVHGILFSISSVVMFGADDVEMLAPYPRLRVVLGSKSRSMSCCHVGILKYLNICFLLHSLRGHDIPSFFHDLFEYPLFSRAPRPSLFPRQPAGLQLCRKARNEPRALLGQII